MTLTGVSSVAAPDPSFPPGGDTLAGAHPVGVTPPRRGSSPHSQETPSSPLGEGVPVSYPGSGWGPGPLTEPGRGALEPQQPRVGAGNSPGCGPSSAAGQPRGLGRRPNMHECVNARAWRVRRRLTPLSICTWGHRRQLDALPLRPACGSVSTMWGCRPSSAGRGACPRPHSQSCWSRQGSTSSQKDSGAFALCSTDKPIEQCESDKAPSKPAGPQCVPPASAPGP